MPADIGPVRELRDKLARQLAGIDDLEAHPALGTLPNFLVHTEAIREHLRATVAHISFLIEQHDLR